MYIPLEMNTNYGNNRFDLYAQNMEKSRLKKKEVISVHNVQCYNMYNVHIMFLCLSPHLLCDVTICIRRGAVCVYKKTL